MWPSLDIISLNQLSLGLELQSSHVHYVRRSESRLFDSTKVCYQIMCRIENIYYCNANVYSYYWYHPFLFRFCFLELDTTQLYCINHCTYVLGSSLVRGIKSVHVLWYHNTKSTEDDCWERMSFMTVKLLCQLPI